MSVESNIYALWAAKQTAKGAVASTATKRLQQVGGNLEITRADGSENFSDLDRFGDATDYVDTLQGGGSPVIHAQPNSTAYLLWLFFGGETFTAGGGGNAPKYEFIPLANTGFWCTFWKRVGLVDIIRQRFADCKITSLRIEGSTASKVVKITPTIVSLDPGEKIAADPAGVNLEVAEPLLYTDVTGKLEIDGAVFRAASQFAIVLDAGMAPWQGDSVTFYDLVSANASVTMEGPTIMLDAASLGVYNTIIYGTASPANGTKPKTDRPIPGSFEAEFARGSGATRESIKIEVPGAKWSPDLAIGPNPDGGPIEVALNGEMRKVTGQPAVRITVETGGAGGDTAAHSA